MHDIVNTLIYVEPLSDW